jgi:outer membrane protein TolC
MWERPSQVRAWEDPQLMFGVKNVPVDDFDFNKIDMTMKEISLSQQIPFPGIPSLKENIAIQEAKSSDQELANKKIQIVKAVKEACADLFLINAHVETAEKNKDLLAKFVKIAEAKYEVGKGLQQDILKAQVEHSKFIERLIDLRQKKLTITAEINRLLGRDPNTALAGNPDIEKKTFPYSIEDLEKMTLEANPALLSIKHLIKRNEDDYKLAKKMYFPSFNVTVAYGQREDYTQNGASFPGTIVNPDGSRENVLIEQPEIRQKRDDLFSLFFGLNIPIWAKSKQSKRVSETHLLIEEAKAQYSAAKNKLFFQIRDLVARENRTANLLELYQNGIIPQSMQSLESSIAGYQVGSVDFLMLLDSQVTLCNYQVQVSEELSSYEKYLAELEAVVGKRLF